MNTQNVKVGTLTIVDDANAINVPVGFAPSYIKVLNSTDAKLYEFFAGMTDAYAFKSISHADTQFSVITSNGITPYDGRAIGASISGTAAVTADSTAVTGTSTNFVGELAVGDLITINGESRKVSSITSATALVVDEAYDETASGATIYDMTGKSEGFTLGTDITDDDSDVLYWIAIR